MQHRPLKQLLFRNLRISAYLALALSLVGSSFFLVAPQKAQAANASDFKAGRIIDDHIFTKENSMTTPEIQNFLNTKGANCTNNCLKDYTQGGKKAASIIREAALDYDINPQVLLVLIQKEQGLVTSSSPSSYMYKYATGYCVTDSGLCGNWWGFTKQVRKAAELFRDIVRDPDTSNYPPGSRRILYNPETSCGRKTVVIENGATSALYHYTPYTPNGSALNNLYGEGNDCSAYGNRNFWRYFSDWFGSPIGNYPSHAIVGDWGGGAADEVGFRNGSNYYYDVGNDGTVNKSFSFGSVKDHVMLGDWDDDGKDEVGIRRGDRYFYDNNNDGVADISFSLGKSTDHALSGDWDGDGRDTIGLRRDKFFYLENTNDGRPEIGFSFGKASDKVIIGDWDGDGRDEVGVRRDKYFYLANSNGVPQYGFSFGKASDSVLVGDWNASGEDTIGLKRFNEYYLDTNNDGNPEIGFTFNFY